MSDKEQKALHIIRRLVDSGFRAVFAGGCVRDRILGVEPKDYDVATDARPEVVQKIFDRTVAVGAKFGVIGVVLDRRRPVRSRDVSRRCRIYRRPPTFVGALRRDRGRRNPARLHHRRHVLRSSCRPPYRSGRRDARSARRNHPRHRQSLRPLRGGSSAHLARRPLRRASELHDRSRDLGRDETRGAEDCRISRPNESAKKSS